MIKVGNILIDPNDISSIHLDMKPTPTSDRDRGFHHIQIIYKSGVVKNFTSAEIGMSYSDFVNSFIEILYSSLLLIRRNRQRNTLKN